jgi:hypothetical protein
MRQRNTSNGTYEAKWERSFFNGRNVDERGGAEAVLRETWRSIERTQESRGRKKGVGVVDDLRDEYRCFGGC